jgi:adenosylhomocysteine nucleosidase
MKTSIDFGLVCAIKEEFQSLISKITVQSKVEIGRKKVVLGHYNKRRIAIIHTGIGHINAAASTAALITQYNPASLLFSGIAGALNPCLNIGDVLIGKSCFQAEAITHEQLRSDWAIPALDKPADSMLLAMAEALYGECPYQVRSGVIVSSDIFPAPKDCKALFQEKQADAIDMETAAFYHACHIFSKPCLSIRSFSNPVTGAEKEVLEAKNIATSSANATDFCFRLIDQCAQNA